jgi:hypothetical protein
MPKAKNNPAYRTQEQLVHDVTVILNTPVTYGTKKVVCWQAASEWTEHSGKYEGCPLWSKKAFDQYQANSEEKGLRHEHAVPKKVLVGELLGLQNPTEKDVGILFLFLIGVVVTVEENKILDSRFQCSMPQEFYDKKSSAFFDVLLRYKNCGIEVGKVDWIKYRTSGCSARWEPLEFSGVGASRGSNAAG